MQRATISLNPEEIKVISLYTSLEDDSRPLIQKIKATSISQEDVIQIELSEEEIETLLDFIGIPNKKEKVEKTNLRDKLRQQLRNMRS